MRAKASPRNRRSPARRRARRRSPRLPTRSPMQLHTIWFVIIAIFWVGYFVLEGFDFGVGMLHTIVGRSETEQRVAINTIGPWWDGNEVWLVVAGASMFAGFPPGDATLFSRPHPALC